MWTFHTSRPSVSRKSKETVRYHIRNGLKRIVSASISIALLFCVSLAASGAELPEIPLLPDVHDRSTGSAGAEATAEYILAAFRESGLDEVGVQEFQTSVPSAESASIELNGNTFQLHPWGPNLVYLSATPASGLRGPLIYAGDGSIAQFDGKPVRDAIVLMEMNSGGNWLQAASFGAAAVIFIGDPRSFREEYEQKNTTAPIAFPRFWASAEEGRALRELANRKEPLEALLKSKTSWRLKTVRNCYGFLKGRDKNHKKELLILEAPYDVRPLVLGLAPGADETISVPVLLAAVKALSRSRPDRSVLFLFSAGNREEQAGARHFIHALSAREKDLAREAKSLAKLKENLGKRLDLARRDNPFETTDAGERTILIDLVSERAKDRADTISRTEMGMRPEGRGSSELRNLRVLAWATSLDGLDQKELSLAGELVSESVSGLKSDRAEVGVRSGSLESVRGLRKLLDGYKPVLFLSLGLSSRSQRLGLVENGATYPIKDEIRRMTRAARLGQILAKASEEFFHSVGSSGLMPGGEEVGFSGEGISTRFRYGSDVAAIAGLPAVALASTGDLHAVWSTPFDTSSLLNRGVLSVQSDFIAKLLLRLASDPSLKNAVQPGVSGFSNLSGQAKFIRSGELFPDDPARGTIISVFQGESLFRGWVNRDGTFFIPGLANNRLTPEKAVIESYLPDHETGRISAAVDRLKTGKENYRLRVKSGSVSTSLVMFRCVQTDIVPILNPATLGYLTRAEVLDARTDAAPIRYWSSLMDRRDNMALSVFLEKGTRFKLGVAESLLGKEFLILSGSQENPTGTGFLAGEPPVISFASLQTARDLFFLAGSRLSTISMHGISNATLESLYRSSIRDLDEARKSLAVHNYSQFWSSIIPAWAKLGVVYREVDREQRDVLAGVIFFIALFVPFAYCMERYLFGFRGIYQQIGAFLGILVVTVLVIRALHPAFQLTYSPMVVILAFFIMCLSLGVCWIIFSRFEQEMARGQGHHQSGAEHVSKRQAFGAGFSIGVSNLNRRKLRTALTCVTLVILTFTVMSFTSVKSSFRTVRTAISNENSYKGLLVRSQFRLPLAPLALEDLEARFNGSEHRVWPKAWIKPPVQMRRNIASIYVGQHAMNVEGVLGTGDNPPDSLKRTLLEGNWFNRGEENSILISSKMAGHFRVRVGDVVGLMGSDFRISGIFDSSLLESFLDLDRNPVIPAYPETGQSESMSEAEMEAIQSGDQLLPQNEKYRYADAARTVLIPFETCIRMGGEIQSLSVLTDSNPFGAADSVSSWLSYPIFIGDNGSWYQNTGTALRYQGASSLVIPILIVILITLNTMISHVYERKREIATYTSVGLAPAHVGFLFMVEALSLAVISTVIGYIVAQFSAHFLADTALFAKLTFNYSSLASIACMFLVFSVVFLAALYPARVATDIAMPDVNRIWKLPPSEGDRIRMNLPFLLKVEEEYGVMNFLAAFFMAHKDSGHGSFTMEDTQLASGPPLTGFHETDFAVCLLFEANAWLAPFDFGIKQRVQIHCCPSYNNPGYLELAILLTRISGEHSAWERANKYFVKDMRKQMLLWRLLDSESKAAFLSSLPERRAEGGGRMTDDG
ncbi:MAG: FtsX-like permease family protein [Syntrophobacteraceae bacterium]